MKFSPIDFAPGTDKSPQHTEVDSLAFTDTNHVHFPDGRLRTVDPWADVTPSSLDVIGAARTIFGHIRSDGIYYLFGTSNRLYAIKNGTWYNMTPLAGQGSRALNANPLDVHSGDATLTITITAHGLSVGDQIILYSATDVDAVDADTYINVRHTIATVPDADTVTVEMAVTAGSTANGGGSDILASTIAATDTLATALDTTITSATVTVNYTAHGLTDGDRIGLREFSAIGGIPATDLNGQHIITYVDADSFTITVSTEATSSVTGAGGTGYIYTPLAAGNIDVSTGAGYGMGNYGIGNYGTAKQATAGTLTYPRIWSFASFGDSMIMNPGDYAAGDGQKIYIWDGDTSLAPTMLQRAPTDCNYLFTFNNAIVALCGNRVDISSVGDGTTWAPSTTSSAFSVDIERVRRFIGGTTVRDAALLFSENEVLYMRWVDQPDYYVIEDLMESDGLIAPNGFTVAEGNCFWLGKRGFYAFGGSGVQRLPNTQNEDWIFENINEGQQWKSFAAYDSKHEQIYWYFPTGAADEPSDYVIFNIKQGHWTLGIQARTAMMRNGFIGSRFYAIYGDSTSQPSNVYRHFLESNEQLTIAPYAETSFGMLGEGDSRMRINRIMPDTNQTGDITLKIITKQYPQSSSENEAIYTITPTQEYLNTRVSGRVRKYRFEQNSTGASFSLGAWKEEIIMQGVR
jgi:hypothetical protein